jgi:hypothetical protein
MQFQQRHSRLGYLIKKTFLRRVKNPKTSFPRYFKLISPIFILKIGYFTLISIMGFNFNDNKIFVPFKTIK